MNIFTYLINQIKSLVNFFNDLDVNNWVDEYNNKYSKNANPETIEDDSNE